MLIIKTKQYEVEEPIKAMDENGDVLYEFDMRITADELRKIEKILLHKDGVKATQELERLEKEGNAEKIEAKTRELEELLLKAENDFASIVFKNHKEAFQLAVGDYKYGEMLEMMFDFFWNAFIEKKATRQNTIRSGLAKISGK